MHEFSCSIRHRIDPEVSKERNFIHLGGGARRRSTESILKIYTALVLEECRYACSELRKEAGAKVDRA